MEIRLEKKEDYFIVETLTREAFWNVYKPGCSEHFVLHAFRDDPDFIKELDFVLEDKIDGITQIIAHVMFVKAKLIRSDKKEIPICTFGPISVSPKMQHKGYGKKILEYAIDEAKKLGIGAICMTGNIAFYGKCGFVTAKSLNINYAEDPDGDAPYFLAQELKAGFLKNELQDMSATFKEPKGYFVKDDDVEEFDLHFPPKTKLRLPGQIF